MLYYKNLQGLIDPNTLKTLYFSWLDTLKYIRNSIV